MRILLAGCNHKTAALAVRERIAFDSESAAAAVQALAGRFPRSEALLVSTCNRVELYVARPAHMPPTPEQVLEFLAERRGLGVGELAGAFYQQADREAAEHLMLVAASLDSMVLGETQILGQVREALRLAQQAGAIGPVLTRLCQDALAVGKRVHAETSLSAGRASVASVAVQFAQRIFSQFADKTVLIVGAGEMGEQVLERLLDLGPRHVLVANRSRQRAEDLAARHRGEVFDLDRLPDALARADIVITSTGSPTALITEPMMRAVMKARRYRDLFLIDIAVPRDVDAAVGGVGRVYLYNIDDLQQVVDSTLQGRAGRVDDARRLLDQQLAGFLAWLRARALGPTIAAFCRHLADLRTEELAWLLPKLAGLSDRDRDLIDQFSHRLIRKVMHDPVRELTNACDPAGASADIYSQVLIKLFGLQVEDDSAAPGSAP